jgi:hypothetical protein
MTAPNEERDSQEQNAESVTDLPPTNPTSEEADTVKGGIDFSGFGDLKAESTDKDHKDWVTILKFDHGVSTPPPVR